MGCGLAYHDDKEGVARSLDKKSVRFDYILPVHSHEELLSASNKKTCATACLQVVLLELPEKHYLQASSGTYIDI